MDRHCRRDVQRMPAGEGEPLLEVDLVRVDEERRIHPLDLLGGLAPHEQRRGLAPVDPAGTGSPALHDHEPPEPQRRGDLRSRPSGSARPRPAGHRRGASAAADRARPLADRRPARRTSAAPAPGTSSESSFSSRHQRPREAPQSARCRPTPCRETAARVRRARSPHRARAPQSDGRRRRHCRERAPRLGGRLRAPRRSRPGSGISRSRPPVLTTQRRFPGHPRIVGPREGSRTSTPPPTRPP